MRLKVRAAHLSLAYNSSLTVIKLLAAVWTGSVMLLSEAVHSASDMVASLMALLSVRYAAQPPDREHPYGHGKAESVAGLGESVLLLTMVGFVAVESAQRLILRTEIRHIELGIYVMAFSTVTSLAVGQYVTRVGVQTRSIALRSNGQHLMVDFWTSLAVLCGLAITMTTGWTQADPVLGLIFCAYMGHGAWKLAREAFGDLLDRRLPDEDEEVVRSILRSDPVVLGFHQLRTRHSGHVHYVDVHIVLPKEWTLVEAHNLADQLEKRIAKALDPAYVVIHVDPYDATRIDPD